MSGFVHIREAIRQAMVEIVNMSRRQERDRKCKEVTGKELLSKLQSQIRLWGIGRGSVSRKRAI